ncbi:MAG: Lrp/AsnC family transcriptional regulator [Alphaproteobacteria bacterium]
MDRIDRRILALLQTDATLSVAAIAETVGLTQTPCWKRIQRLEKSGVIRGRVALLDAAALGVPVTVFVSVRTNRHEPDWLERFADGVTSLPEVVEVYRMSGAVDYLLKIVCPDIAGYDRVYKRLIAIVDIQDVSSAFSMEELKKTTALPLDYAGLD